MDTTHIYIQDYRVGGWLGLVFSTSTIGLGGRHKTSTDTVSRSIPQWLVQGRAAGVWGWRLVFFGEVHTVCRPSDFSSRAVQAITHGTAHSGRELLQQQLIRPQPQQEAVLDK